jgi:thiol-disulfide isomerase/thioredoxin
MKSFLIFILILVLTVPVSRAQSKLKVETLDKEKLTNLVHRRNGKILFLNLWATWCVPCREEFPDIIKLVHEFKDKNIEFVGISIDYPEDINSKIIPFLKLKKANFKNFVNGIKGDEELINMLDEKWSGALPATFIFDVSGQRRFLLEGRQNYEQFKLVLEKIN